MEIFDKLIYEFLQKAIILGYDVTPRPGEVDTWQSPRALEWILVSQDPSKDSQGTWHPSPFEKKTGTLPLQILRLN